MQNWTSCIDHICRIGRETFDEDDEPSCLSSRFVKENICRHAIGVAIRLEKVITPTEVLMD